MASQEKFEIMIFFFPGKWKIIIQFEKKLKFNHLSKLKSSWFSDYNYRKYPYNHCGQLDEFQFLRKCQEQEMQMETPDKPGMQDKEHFCNLLRFKHFTFLA